MKILGSDLLYPPTNQDYKRETFPIGVRRRTLDGSIDTHVRATKKRWSFKVLEQGLEALLIPYLDGTPFEFEDIDEEEYMVVLTGVVPVAGYPTVAELSITLEEA